MNGPVRSRRGLSLVVMAPALLGLMIIPAGRSGAGEMNAEEVNTVSSNTVAQGLKTIQTASEEIVKQAGADKAAAQKTVGVIAPVWSMIEGAIRANSQESYSALEKALEELSAAAETGDTRKAGAAAGAFSSAVKFYVAKFSGAAAAADQRAAPDKRAAAGEPAAGRGERTAAATPAPAPANTPPAPAAADASRAAAAATPPPAPSGTLARTGPASALIALSGLALGLGGLAVFGGARRRHP